MAAQIHHKRTKRADQVPVVPDIVQGETPAYTAKQRRYTVL